MKKRLVVYFLSTFLVPFLFEEALSRVIAMDASRAWLWRFVFFSAMILLACAIEFVIWLVNVIRTPDVQTMLGRVDEQTKKYVLVSGQKMFDVPDSEFDLMYVKNARKLLGRRHCFIRKPHTIYHSLSVKKHLSWVEFIFWDFLRDLRENLGFKIVVAFHEDESGRESGETYNAQRYAEMCEAFSVIARKVIGPEITIINESDLLKKSPKAYCDFHNIYVSQMLGYARQVAQGEADYSQFMRGLSFAESVFPLISMAKKYDRIYAIDRKKALDIWNNPPLNDIKKDENIYFILVQTLTDSQGNPLRIFTPEECLNITDDEQTVRDKMKKMPEGEKMAMYHIISTNTDYAPRNDGTDTDEEIISCILSIKRKHQL